MLEPLTSDSVISVVDLIMLAEHVTVKNSQ